MGEFPDHTSAVGHYGGRSQTSPIRTQSDALERARGALAYLDPQDQEIWLKVGMGLSAEFGDAGWPIFDDWSRQAGNYHERQNRARWKSFRPDGGITVATVYGLAKAAGWRDHGFNLVPEPKIVAGKSKAVDPAVKGAAKAQRIEAANKAALLWSASAHFSDHPYLRRKAIAPNAGLRGIAVAKAVEVLDYSPRSKDGELVGDLLVVPITVGDSLSSVQLVDCDGRKHFLFGGAIGGGYWSSQPLPSCDGAGLTLLIAEGVATALSASQATGHIAVATMANFNLPVIAGLLRDRFPKCELVLLADVDKVSGKPDRYAVEAAKSVGGKLAIPHFAAGHSPGTKDFNDLACLSGERSVRIAIEAAQTPRGHDDEPSGTTSVGKVELIRASAIKPEPVRWLWPNYLAAGKMHVLGGKPAAGKTTLALAMAATITQGQTWPDGEHCKPGTVLIWSGEDDPADTLVPRLIAAGAELERVHFISGAIQGNVTVPFDPARHMQALAAHSKGIADLALLIVDPIVSAVAGDSYKNAEVRRALQPLADLGAQTGCAVLGITHFTKGTGGRDPVERLTGSLAFGALARIVLVAAKAKDGWADVEERTTQPHRIMLRAKSNLGPDGDGFEYQLEQKELAGHPGITGSVVTWGKPIHGSAQQLLADAEETNDVENGSSLSEARDWLEAILSDQPLEQQRVKREAAAAGHSWATVRRAKKLLGIEARKQGMKGSWLWALPRRCSEMTEGAPPNEVSAFENFEPLRPEDTAKLDTANIRVIDRG